jgi:ketosteroid isomerase-like protein
MSYLASILRSMLIACLVLGASLAQAQELIGDIESAERLWGETWTKGDKDTYRRLLSDDFTWTYVDGEVIDKEEAIARLNPFTIPENSKTINEYDGAAVVYGTASLNFRGRPITERFVRVWTKNEDGEWQVVLFQATEIQLE